MWRPGRRARDDSDSEAFDEPAGPLVEKVLSLSYSIAYLTAEHFFAAIFYEHLHCDIQREGIFPSMAHLAVSDAIQRR